MSSDLFWHRPLAGGLLMLCCASNGLAHHDGHAHEAGAEMASGAVAPDAHSPKPAHAGAVARAWTDYPMLKVMASGGALRREVAILPKNLVPAMVEAYSGNLQARDAHQALPYDLVTAKLDTKKSGGFFWLTAKEEQADQVRVASTMYYLSERGSKNPTAMLMQQKNALEIIPEPFPREHSRYRANEDWKFRVRFNGTPLAHQSLDLVTQNATHLRLTTDASGVVTLKLPDDFEAARSAAGSAHAHDHGRRSADFVLATRYVDGGKTYLTGFNANYGPDAFDQRSLALGLGFMGVGMLGAVPLLRRREGKKQAAPAASEE